MKEVKQTNYSVKEKADNAFNIMKDEFHYKIKLQAPKIQKISISISTGRAMKNDKKKNEFIIDRLLKIVGQRAVETQAKKAIASFKTRIGDKIGVSITLRGPRMYGFLEKLLNVSIPRTKDFRGYNDKSVDDIGNLTLSIKEHTIFPETADEDIKDVFGLAVTIVTSAKTKKEGQAFFDLIGVPFKK